MNEEKRGKEQRRSVRVRRKEGRNGTKNIRCQARRGKEPGKEYEGEHNRRGKIRKGAEEGI